MKYCVLLDIKEKTLKKLSKQQLMGPAMKKVQIQNKEQLELVWEEITVSSLFNHPSCSLLGSWLDGPGRARLAAQYCPAVAPPARVCWPRRPVPRVCTASSGLFPRGCYAPHNPGRASGCFSPPVWYVLTRAGKGTRADQAAHGLAPARPCGVICPARVSDPEQIRPCIRVFVRLSCAGDLGRACPSVWSD
ncbi:hypothetical protein Bca52824_035262 [Brassica carinata]|uniref:Uncharacterized protein n=1 Tax=Brassica carinata TaxID=52824 RepID=A0A8X7S2E1_BRACI|nr:hypothetical protein Bca52824_035262 [Brassica carinata]